MFDVEKNERWSFELYIPAHENRRHTYNSDPTFRTDTDFIGTFSVIYPCVDHWICIAVLMSVYTAFGSRTFVLMGMGRRNTLVVHEKMETVLKRTFSQ